MKSEDVKTPEQLIEYLENLAKQLGNSDYLYHYTNMYSALAILKDRKWFFNSPLNMNDGMESLQIKNNRSKNLFFSSFLLEDTENIGMWSMYGQPWEKGVMIKIPIEMLKKWSRSKPSVWSCTRENKQPQKDLTDKARISLYKVAYTNAVLPDYNSEHETLICGGKCISINNALRTPALSGYVKNKAWEYEKEVRLRVDIDLEISIDGILVDIPDEVIDSIILVQGPRFEANLLKEVRRYAVQDFSGERIELSSFTGLLNWVYCNSCQYHPTTNKNKI